MMFGFVILIIIAFYIFNSSDQGRQGCINHHAQTQTPLDILNERYARGEIQQDEYFERKQELVK